MIGGANIQTARNRTHPAGHFIATTNIILPGEGAGNTQRTRSLLSARRVIPAITGERPTMGRSYILNFWRPLNYGVDSRAVTSPDVK